MTDVGEGDLAPSFTLHGTGGQTVSLGDLRGKRVVLYFYPADDTPGCTTEACDFRDSYAPLVSADAVILGVSPDSVESHEKFAKKFGLNFTLLSDPDHAVADQYGAWKEKNLYGRKYMGIDRSTFLIGPDGRVEKAWRRVRAKGHAQKVLEAVNTSTSA